MLENPLINEQDMMKEGKHLFPKGKVGNWKTSLTQEQSEQIDKLISSQLGKDFIGSYISYSGRASYRIVEARASLLLFPKITTKNNKYEMPLRKF